MSDIPTVEPIDIPKYQFKNSKYEMMPSLPARMLAVASSTGGKTVLIQNLILKIYRNSFERIYIFSPSVDVDDTWNAVKKYIKDVSGLGKGTDIFQSLRRNCLTENNRHPTQGNRIPEEKQRQGFIQYINSH